MKKIYRGFYDAQDISHVTVTVLGKSRHTRPLRHVNYHSPTGFAWGYGGSGPADLALSILADHLGERITGAMIHRGAGPRREYRCLEMYQSFKWAVVATWPEHGWTLTSDDVARWIEEWAARRATPAPEVQP